jgi:hypothetical protein
MTVISMPRPAVAGHDEGFLTAGPAGPGGTSAWPLLFLLVIVPLRPPLVIHQLSPRRRDNRGQHYAAVR